MNLWRVFLKYCFQYFVAFLIVLSCCMVLAFVAYRSIEGYVINENEAKLVNGINSIKEDISKMELIPQMIKRTASFRTLTQLNSTANAKNYLDIKSANREYKDVGLLYTFSDYIFALFRNNDVFLSTDQCSAEFSSFFGNMFIVKDGIVVDAESFKEQIFKKNAAGELFWQVDSLEYYKQGRNMVINNAILCLANDNTNALNDPAYATVFVLDPTTLLQRILTQDSFVQDAKVSIKSTKTNEILLSNSENQGQELSDKAKYLMVSYAIPEINWAIDIAFPKTIIDKQCAGIRMVIYIYIGVGLLIVLIMTLFMSYRQYIHIKQLFVHIPVKTQSIPKGQDEYETLHVLLSGITDNNTQYKNQIAALTQQNQAIMLESLITRGINSQEERQQFEKVVPKIMDFFCIVLMEIESEDLRRSNQTVIFITEFLKANYPRQFINVHTSIKEELFLLSFSLEDTPNVQNVQILFEKAVAAIVGKANIDFKIGISTIGSDLVNINKCYNQAKQVVQANQWTRQSFVRSYQQEAGEIKENLVGMEFLDKLYNLLLCAERESVSDLLQRTFVQFKKAPFFYEKHKHEIFYSISNIIRSAYSVLAVDFSESSDIAFYGLSNTVEEMEHKFLQAVEAFCDAVNEHKKSSDNELNEKIVGYINQNFVNSSLNADLVCCELGISEKYLLKLLKELTGETFACYLEHIRIDAAVQYLLTTDMSNEKIAKATGFAAINTFYRVFNKRMGVSPGAYRSNLNQS